MNSLQDVVHLFALMAFIQLPAGRRPKHPRRFTLLRSRRASTCFLAFLAFALPRAHSQTTALDLTGKPFNPITAASGKTVALIFVRRDCPISSRYAPTIQRLSEQYSRDARFYLVFPDKTETSALIRKYLGDYHYTVPALRDPEHALVKLARAQITPEAAVFDRKGTLVYHGRIDNLYEDVARARPQATTHELNDALQAVIHGSPLLAKETSAVGCYISDLP
jgi:thiol-disulfide isomerase/thioredoxin